MEDRLKRIKERLFQSYYEKKEWWGDELSIFDDDPTYAEKPLVVRKAIALQKVCREMPIGLENDELVVGKPTMASVGFGHMFPKYETDEEAEASAKVTLNRKSVWGHHNPYYPKILERGLEAVIEEAEKLRDRLAEDEAETREWYNAVVVALQGAEILSRRYADLLEYSAEEAETQQRKHEMLEMAKICRRVPMKPATSLHEALQSVWFIHTILHSTLNYTSIGRVDQYLWPFYKKDIDTGVINREQARELLGSFLVKFNERVQLDNVHIEDHFTFGDWSQGGDPDLETTHLKMSNDEEYTFGQSSNHWLQNCILSGLTSEGKDGTNDLTYMIIELTNELELIDPLISVRLHKDSPRELLEATARALAKGGAQPTVFNDDVFIPGLVEHLGIPYEDAADYSNDGCWEALPQGRTEFAYGHIEVLLSLESLLNRGKSLLNGNPIGPDMGDPSRFETFDQLFEAFKRQVADRLDTALENKFRYYDEVYKIAPVPFLSGIMEDCLQKGRDMTQKGARYRLYAPLITGYSHAIDSLAAIKQLVYEEKKLSMKELVDILRGNWEGNEKLRQYALNRVPKYGNDDDYVDQIGVRFLSWYCDYCDQWNEKVDWIILSPGAGTFENFPRLGYVCGASADGRMAQAPIASNFSPSFGMDTSGPTAVVKSSTKFDLKRLNDGCPVDMRISFTGADSPKGYRILEDFIKSFIELGGNILTITSVSVSTLKAAQKEPEKYASLRVRLGGLTAYFVQLCDTQQNEYIKRTEHGF
jgi:formate C-acetyltransferase